MKKLLSLVFLTLLFFSLSAQKQIIFIDEDFSGSFLPTGWTIDAHSSSWFQSNTNEAGGSAPEIKLYWSPQFNGVSRLISPQIDLTGITELVLSFKHFVDNYSGGITFGVATTSDGVNWSDAWTISPSNDVGPEAVNLILDGSDIGSSTFQICFYFSGNSYNIDNWYIDDIQLFKADDLDLKLSNIANNEYVLFGDQLISITLQNVGNNTVTSADLNYQVDGGTIVTESIGSVGIDLNDFYTFNFTQQYTFTSGDHELKVWLENVNGTGDDDDISNDMLIKTIHVANNSVTKKALYEEFTSSTCAPCASFNSTYFTEDYLSSNDGAYTLIKYQMSWPSPGDPYYTEEGGTRRAFYGVSGVPTLYLDGAEGTYFDQGLLQNALDNAIAEPAFFEINPYYEIVGNKITVVSEIMPFVNADDFTVHIAVIEKMTTGNTGNNGETEFYNVMMKMMPDGEGQNVDFRIGEKLIRSNTFDMSSTFVEEMDDLEVVVFVQNNKTRKVFQSAYGTEGLPTVTAVSFDPIDQAEDVELTDNIHVYFNTSMRLLDNSEITSENISDFISLTDASKANIDFDATIDESKMVIELNPVYYLPMDSEITISLTGSAIENISDVAFSDISSSFYTETLIDPTVMFTPVDGDTGIAVNANIILDFNIAVCFDDEAEITNSDVANFVSVSDPSKTDIPFTAVVDMNNYRITITPDNDFDYETGITVDFTGSNIINYGHVGMSDESITFTTEKAPIKITEVAKSIVSVYPNPASDKIVIDCIAGSVIKIIDLNGKVVFENNSTQKSNTIDVSNLTQGVYLINISGDNYNETQKITIIR
ncbi:MAG: Ig-like domain-containing protein [Bacteroidales bacterium]|nr:Ig-like domain-containing protein [Bacteroidales bacterium]